MLPNLHGHALGGVVAQNVDDLYHHIVGAGRLVRAVGRELELGVLLRPIALPLVVEGVVPMVPVHRPVVYVLAPVGQRALHVLRYVLGGTMKSQSSMRTSRPGFAVSSTSRAG